MTSPSQILSEVIQFIVQWIFVPVVLIGLLIIAGRITVIPSADRWQDISKRLAFILGLALFVLLVVVNISVSFIPVFPPLSIQTILVFVLTGITLGFLLMLAIHLLAKTRAISLFIILLTSVSLIGLYYYIVADQSRNPILLIIIGFLVGGLIYGVFNPTIFKDLR